MDKKKITKNFGNRISAENLFFGGILLIPLVLTGASLPFKGGLNLLFISLLLLRGDKVKLHFYLILIFGVVLGELLIPQGQLLFKIGSFLITKDALFAGLNRAFTFTALMMVSRLAISRALKFPGRFGALLSSVLYNSQRLFNLRAKIRIKSLFESLDNLLIDYYNPESEFGSDVTVTLGTETPLDKRKGFFWVLSLLMIVYGVYITLKIFVLI